MIEIATLVPLLPLLGGLIAAVGARRLKGNAHWPVVIGIGLAFVISSILLIRVSGGGPSHGIVAPWIEAGALRVPVELRVDGLTTMMLAMITFVATVIAVFASGYMAGDPGYARFFAVVGLFVFSMTGLVLSGNFALTYAFWEGVGVCSYLLIGFWHEKPSAAAAAKKAFLVNRIGDFGFAVALFWMWTTFGHSLSYDAILNRAALDAVPTATKLGIALLLFWAATAKSAQVPLYVWLPDAMEGPTPVSALIHAATMVTAGVYLIARSSLLIVEVPEAQLVVAIVGCLTALLAALIALTQTDLKRVLAYSTVSQLGFMFMGLGAGIGGVARLAVVAAMFHLFTHAFFKALLFLGSGSVMHAMGGVIDMRRFRGLRHRLPWTFRTFTVGVLALAGIVPLAGFWSKDEVLLALKSAAHAVHEFHHPDWWATAYGAIYYVAIFTAFLTAFYTGRAYFLTFFGPEKLPSPDDPEAEPAAAHHGHDDHGHGHDAHEVGHESPPIMWVPLMVLAVGSILVGMAFGPTKLFEHHLMKTPGFEHLETHEHGFDVPTAVLGTIAGVAGLALSWWLYAKPSTVPGKLANSARPLYRASLGKFYVDELYGRIVVLPTLILAQVAKFLDVYLVDGLVRLTAWVPRMVGRDLLAPFQNGLVQFYAAVTALGLAFLLFILSLT